jgi:hypothetical protein
MEVREMESIEYYENLIAQSEKSIEQLGREADEIKTRLNRINELVSYELQDIADARVQIEKANGISVD